MAKSLQEQMISAGLIDKKKARKIKTDQQKSNRKQRQRGSAPAQSTEQKLNEASKVRAKLDRDLNLQRQMRNEQNAVAAQIRQMVQANRLPKEKDGEAVFNFVVLGKVKKIYVSQETRERISSGKLAIVKVDRQFDLIPSNLVEKLRKRSETCVVFHNDPQKADENAEADYPEHKVPDDLMW
ncbi:MAG: DUF2058 domain-containing protein [Gammaproteobacteria bacterium]|nr:DUF2058 domain-containing protein [Gammaproteobacteria bacterium]